MCSSFLTGTEKRGVAWTTEPGARPYGTLVSRISAGTILDTRGRSWHVQSGTPIHVIQKLGGWHSYAMVQRYAHLEPKHLAKWAENTQVL